jgi:hypothetical protein
VAGSTSIITKHLLWAESEPEPVSAEFIFDVRSMNILPPSMIHQSGYSLDQSSPDDDDGLVRVPHARFSSLRFAIDAYKRDQYWESGDDIVIVNPGPQK